MHEVGKHDGTAVPRRTGCPCHHARLCVRRTGDRASRHGHSTAVLLGCRLRVVPASSARCRPLFSSDLLFLMLGASLNL